MEQSTQTKVISVQSNQFRISQTSIAYRLDLSVETALKIFKHDAEIGFGGLDRKLETCGAHNINYNGHFGPSIFFEIDCEIKNVKEVKNKIKKTIMEHLKYIK